MEMGLATIINIFFSAYEGPGNVLNTYSPFNPHNNPTELALLCIFHRKPGHKDVK